jgi:hypothetical protein
LEIDTGGLVPVAVPGTEMEHPVIGDALWTRALDGSAVAQLADLHEMRAGDAVPALAEAVRRMLAEPGAFAAAGSDAADADSARDFLYHLARACGRHPGTRIAVAR